MDNYSHIELTEEEVTLAIIEAKRKKEVDQKMQEMQRIAEENRRLFTKSRWSIAQTEAFMKYRAEVLFKEKVFNKPFIIDEHNEIVYKLLCLYFSEDSEFVSIAEGIGIKNPSLDKGLLIPGNFGVGKTWLMKLFSKNQRQVFFIRHAKQDIAQGYLNSKPPQIPEQYIVPFKNAVNDSAMMYHPIAGLCIDDIGTEDVKNNFGNKVNVIGDLIESRYAAGHIGTLLHGTTNFSTDQLEEYYGGRVVSRMREIFNWIELPGNDRRQ